MEEIISKNDFEIYFNKNTINHNEWIEYKYKKLCITKCCPVEAPVEE